MRIMDDRAEVTKLQKGHGEWNEDMLDVRAPLLLLFIHNHASIPVLFDIHTHIHSYSHLHTCTSTHAYAHMHMHTILT